MNGRVYAPGLGRMLSPDPVTQAPKDGQNYNRYSYVSNNPLQYTDPSGFIKSVQKWAVIQLHATDSSGSNGVTHASIGGEKLVRIGDYWIPEDQYNEYLSHNSSGATTSSFSASGAELATSTTFGGNRSMPGDEISTSGDFVSNNDAPIGSGSGDEFDCSAEYGQACIKVTDDLLASKGGKQNISVAGFNRHSDPKDVAAAMEQEEKANGKSKHFKALRALLKVISRGGRAIVPVLPKGFEQTLEIQNFPEYDINDPDQLRQCYNDYRCV